LLFAYLTSADFPDGQFPRILVQPSREKNSACAVGQITFTTSPRSGPITEGRIAIVTKRWALNAVDAMVSLRAFGVQGERQQCRRRSRVVLAPRRWR
jgi:hypothetical protein